MKSLSISTLLILLLSLQSCDEGMKHDKSKMTPLVRCAVADTWTQDSTDTFIGFAFINSSKTLRVVFDMTDVSLYSNDPKLPLYSQQWNYIDSLNSRNEYLKALNTNDQLHRPLKINREDEYFLIKKIRPLAESLMAKREREREEERERVKGEEQHYLDSLRISIYGKDACK